MTKMANAILTVAIVAALASAAHAGGAFTFEGFSFYTPPAEAVGNNLVAVGIANPPTPGTPTPIPLDFTTKQYTIRVTLLLTSKSGSPATQLNLGYTTGSWEMFEDGFTAANYSNLSTFVDGTIILSGTISGFNASLQNDVTGLAFGSGVGSFAYTGGTRLADIQATNPIDCSFMGTVIRDGSPIFNPMPTAQFTRTFNMKMFCTEGVVDEQKSWGTLKGTYHD